MTAHISAKKGEIAKTVIMPGDPLRAKFIAEKYLEDFKLVSSVRNNYIYTGTYKGKEISVMSSGMGMPSMGIYSYELFNFYDVENIIRIGTSGSNKKEVKISDIVLAESSYSLSTIANLFDDFYEKEIKSSEKLNNIIEDCSKQLNIELKKGRIITTDVFDVYVDSKKYFNHYPKDLDTLASEMEAYILFFLAKKFKKNASCLLTVVDSKYEKKELSSEDREKNLINMIELALFSTTKL
ncbi:MAG: purine-nucleoside phosphorylase [Bacilli bacterium]|nr:purine-nucleoside phosphorylase [Bacilli bacterium]